MSVRDRLEKVAGLPAELPAITAENPQGVELNDPSMPGMPTVAAPTTSLRPVEPSVPGATVSAIVETAPVIETPAPELPEQRFTYQPTDENGKPMGGLQVVKYRTNEELRDVLANNSVLLQRQLRKERREKLLGTPEATPDDAEKFTNIVEFKPRELSADERFQLSQDIVNPETFADARDRLVESAFGAKPAVLASTLNETQRFMIQQRAVENYVEFVRNTNFPDTLENRTSVTTWLGKRNLAPTVANFVLAQNRLKEAGLLQEAPEVQQEPVQTPVPVAVATPAPVVPVAQEPNPQVPTTTPPALVVQESQAKRQSHVPSGLNASIASPAGQVIPVGGLSMTLADIDKMSSDEYKRRLRDPGFAAYVNKLEEDAARLRRARMAQAQ